MTQSFLTLEFVRVPVSARALPGEVDFVLTALPVALAFKDQGVAPANGDWVNATWETDARGKHYARVLVGPSGDIFLPIGSYSVWIKITDIPEVVVRDTGSVLEIE